MWSRTKRWLYRKMGWGANLILRKGHVVNGPDSMGYKVSRHIYAGDLMRKKDFKPFGGAPEFEHPYLAPQWLKDQV